MSLPAFECVCVCVLSLTLCLDLIVQTETSNKWSREYLLRVFGNIKNDAEKSFWDNHFMFSRGGVRPALLFLAAPPPPPHPSLFPHPPSSSFPPPAPP